MGRLIDMARSQKSSSSRAGSLIAKARAGTLIKSINDFQDKVMNLGAQYNSRYFDVNGQALPVTWRADSGDWLKTVEPQWKANIAEADALAEQLRGYKDYFDEDTYTKAMDAINAAAAGNRQIYTRAQQEHAAFSPFTNEKDYKLVSPWIGQDEATAQKTWNNLNRNQTLAYSQDDAAMIDEAQYALDLFADYYAGTGRSDGVSRMTQEHQQNRRIQHRDELDAKINKLYDEYWESDANDPRAGVSNGEYMARQNEFTKLLNPLKEERDAVDEDIRKYDASSGSQMNKYIDLTRNVDFAEKSQIINTNNPTVQEMVSFQENPSTRENVPKVDDEFEFYISMSPEDRQKVLDYSIGDTKYAEAAAVLQRGDTKKWAQINENDVKMYRYIKETQGQKAANKYLGDLGRELADRENVKFIEDVEKAGPLAKVGMAMVAAPLSFIGGAAEGFTNGIVTLLGGRPQRTDMANAGRVFNETVMEDLSGGKEGFGWDDVYSAWQSSNESALAMLTSLAFGDGSGKLGTILMGFGAANNEMHRLYQEGASPVEISVGGALAGFTEYMTEQLPMEQLLDNFTGGNAHNVRKMIGLWLKQAGLEGFEEGISTIANALNDYLIRGNRSDIAKEVKVNKAKGLSDGQALWAAIKSVGAEAGEAALQGVMSGAMGGAWSSGVGLANYKAWTKGYAADAMKDADVFHSLMDTAQELSVNATGRTKVNLDAAIAKVSESKNEQNLANLVDKANLAARKVSAKALIESSGSKNPLKRMSLRNKAKSSSEAVMDMEIAERTMAAKIERDSVKRTYTVGNGVTTNAKTGEEIRITGIHRTYENGDPTLVFKLDDGSTIRSDEVSYANDNMAVMAEALAKTGIRADYAQKLLDSVTEKGNAVDAVLGMRAAIEAGSIGANYDMARKEGDAAYLTDKQFRAAYEAGQLLGKNNLNKQIGLASQKTATDANLTQEGGNFVGSFYDGTKPPVSALKNGEGTRTLTNTSKDGTVSSDDVKNMARNKGYAKREFSFQWKQFPPYDKSFSEANQLATRWAYEDRVQSGDTAYLSCNDRWYMIQKFDDVPSHYMVMERLSEAEYRKRKEKERYAYELSTSEQDGGTVFESLGVSDSKHGTVRDGKNDNHISMRNGSADGSVHGLGDQERSGREKYSLRRDRSDVRSQRRTQGSADPNAQGGQTVKTTESKKADGEPNRLSVAVDPKSLLRSTTQAQVNVLESMAKLFNVNIEIYASSVVDGVRQFTDRRGRVYKGNAAYTRVGNTILVDVNAGDYLNGLMLNAVSHELVHYVREMSPEKFRKLADFVVEKFGEKGHSVTLLIRNKQAKYARQGESLSFDDAYEEVVADSLESMLAQNADKVVSDVAELRKVDADLAKSLVDKLRDTVKKMLNIFKKEGFHSKPESEEGKLFAEWTEYHEQLTSLFSEAVADAADRSAQAARRTSPKENTPELSEAVKYSFRNSKDGSAHDVLKPYGAELRSLITKKGDVIVDSYDSLVNVVNKAFDNPKGKFTAYFGILPYSTIREIEKSIPNIPRDLSGHVFKVGRDYSIAIESDNIIHLTDNKKTMTREDVVDFLDRVADVVVESDSAHFDYYTDGYGQRTNGILFKKAFADGVLENFNLVSSKKNSLKVQTMYLDSASYQKRKSAKTLPVQNTASAHTSKTGAGQTSNTIISNHEQKSQEGTEKSSLRNVTERQTIVEMLRTMSTEVEHNKYFQEYLQKASTLDRKQAKLDAFNEEWRDLMFQKGERSEQTKARLAEIRTEIEKLIQELDRTDKRLLQLAELRPFRNIVKNAEKRQRQKDNKKMADYRKEVKRRANREKVVRAMKDITSYILHETKDHRIPAELRKQFVDVLSSFNLDFSTGANKQVRHYLNDLADALDKFQQSNSPMVEVWQDSIIQDMLKDAKERLGNTSIYNMTQDQLDIIYQLFRTMKKRITSADKIMSDKAKKGAMDRTKAIVDEVEKRKTKRSDKTTQFSFDNMKPLYFFERIGSDTLMGLYNNIRQGQNAYARDLMEADKFRQTVEKKYGAESWSISKTKTFKDAAGEDMHLTLANIMSLYAHGRREQSRKHLFAHGIVLDEEVVAERNKAGKIERYKVDDKRNHPLNQEVFTAIISSLTKEQRAYIEEMQDYLSDVMGQKGNEISLAMYDLELFTEKHYWPLKTAAWWNAFNPEAGFDPKIKSPSFAKSTNKHATSPIVLQGFSAVWSNHVHDMSLYHGLALPVDDFTRVVNVRTVDNPIHVGGVRQALDEVYGKGAGQYITQLLRDLNGGIRATDDAWLTKGISLAKKAATALSLSVAIQQPSSIMRAMAVIEAKYFGRLDKDMKVKGVFDAWEELKQYCPVAYIKEMGNMDTGVGRSAVEHLQKRGFGDAKIKDILKDKNYRKQLGAKIDDIIGFLPQFMDQVTWVKLWRSAQNKARALNPDLSAHEVKVKAAEIFDDCIERTQVYDSPLSRSGIMRKGGAATKQATAFLAEPTTTINMAYMAALNVIRNKPGARKQLGRTMGSILGATVLNAILKSIITAMRDDDEDETMIEKYVEHFVGNFAADALIFTNLPYVRDIISLFEGYDVERMDMSTVGNLIDSIKAMTKDSVTLEEIFDGIFSVAGLFGVPLKNVKREVMAIINTVETVSDEIAGKRKMTGTGLWSAAVEGLPFTEEANKGDMLYRAYKSGNEDDIRVYRSHYASESAANSGVKAALRNRKSEDIMKAATLRYNGDLKGSARIVERMARETNIPVELVQQAVMAEVEAIVKRNEPEKDPYDGGYDGESSNPSKYTTADLKLAVEQGREVDVIVDSIVADKKAQGFSVSQAKSQVKNSLMSTYKSKYMDAYQMGDKSEMERIISLLVKTGLWDRSAVVNIMKNYIKNEEESK